MALKFNEPTKAVLRRQIAEHIAETEKTPKTNLREANYEPLPADRFFDREISWLKFNQRVLELAEDEKLPALERSNFSWCASPV